MFGHLANMMNRAAVPTVATVPYTSIGNIQRAGGTAPVLNPYQRPQYDQLAGLFGPPNATIPTRDQIAATVYAPPYNGPLDLDNYACETADMRFDYDLQYREEPVVRSAVRGLADDVVTSDIMVVAQNQDNPIEVYAAKFFEWTVTETDQGWRGVLDSVYTPSSIRGWSLSEPTLQAVNYKGRSLYGLKHVRSIDTRYMRLQLDIFRNVIAIVNMVRGLEYYEPSSCILHTLNGLYSNPFGQSDMRAVTRAAQIIGDVYLIWYAALKLYGLPYMIGKAASPTDRQALQSAMEGLREFGYLVCGPEDSVEALNLAAAAAIQGFESMVQMQRENIYLGVRHTGGQNYMESKGGADKHTDTKVQQGNSDTGVKSRTMALASTIRRLAIRVISRNFGNIPMPHIKFGGVDWEQTKTVVDATANAMEKTGIDPSLEWFSRQVDMPVAKGPADSLQQLLAKAKQAQAAAQQPPQPGQPAPAAPQLPQPSAQGQFSDGPTPEQVRRSIERYKQGRGK